MILFSLKLALDRDNKSRASGALPLFTGYREQPAPSVGCWFTRKRENTVFLRPDRPDTPFEKTHLTGATDRYVREHC